MKHKITTNKFKTLRGDILTNPCTEIGMAASKEIDGWVFEFECPQCLRDVTVGLTNHGDGLDTDSRVNYCPFCDVHLGDSAPIPRTLYTTDFKAVHEHIKENNKVAAIREYRALTRKSLRESKERVEMWMDEYRDIKGRKD